MHPFDMSSFLMQSEFAPELRFEFFFSNFRFFARRFWNQIFTCLSDSARLAASFDFSRIVMYGENMKCFSNSTRW
jgi:hypothetical protein